MMRGNVAQEVEGPRFVAAFAALAGDAQGAVGAGGASSIRFASRYASRAA